MKECNGVVYKITDLETGQFYIGETQLDKWETGYPGSGRQWRSHFDAHPDHHYKRDLLHKNIKDYDVLYELEIEEIRKYCEYDGLKWKKINSLMLNNKYSKQPEIAELSPCSECGALRGHTKQCSQYIKRKICRECGSESYRHKSWCSKYKSPKPCKECGKVRGHSKICSKYNYKPCSECGVIHGHLNSCSKKNNKETICEECNGMNGKHYKVCSKYKEFTCKECGCSSGHFKTCSKYTERKHCPECGAIGSHLKTCSKSKNCPECGYSIQSHRHDPTCSRYKEPKLCEECGSKTTHKEYCSKYKENKCSICGSLTKHKSWCSNK